MSDSISKLFSSAPGIERVNIFGLIVLAVGTLVNIFANKIAAFFPQDKQERTFFVFKLASILICIAGFVIAVI